MNLWLYGLLPMLDIFDMSILAVGCLPVIQKLKPLTLHVQHSLHSTLRGCFTCLASHIPLLMSYVCSLTPRTVGNEKCMKSFWNSVYDYHNTSTIEGVCLSCFTRGMHYTKDTCTHVLQKMTIFALFSSLSIGTEVLFPVRVSTFEHPKSFLFLISLCRSSL